jgi:creatinine amidohydrolase
VSRSILLAELTSEEVAEAQAEGFSRIVFACGSTEQHGPHLPLAVDSMIGAALSHEVALRLGNTLVAPVITVGCSEHHMAFPGSLTLREETFQAVVVDYCASLGRHGFEEICVLPSHGGNFRPVAEALATARAASAGAVVVGYTDLLDLVGSWRTIIDQAGGPADHVGGHADIAEASMILALAPELVREDRARPGYVGDLEAALPVIWESGFAAITTNGVLGDPTGMSAELGRLLIAEVSERIAAHFRTELEAHRVR